MWTDLQKQDLNLQYKVLKTLGAYLHVFEKIP